MVSTNDVVVNEVASVDVQQLPPAEIKSISEEDFEKAQKTFQLGKKNLFLNKFDESVNNIGEACKIYTTKYGEFDSQCADVYFFYGKALLELARVENTVLGNALTGVLEETNGPIDDSRYGNPEDVNAEEKQEIAEKVIEALCEPIDDEKAPVESEQNGKENGKENGEEKIEVDAAAAKTEENKEKCVEEKPAEAAAESAEKVEKAAKEGEENAEGGENGEEEEDDEEDEEVGEEGEDIAKNENDDAKDDTENEDISNLQRSWEMFELAKLVYTKNFNEDLPFKNKRIAECLLKLGEISIEQEIYDQAINDINESIRMQEEQKDDQRDERMLAESFYQLGLAHQFNNQFSDANEAFQKSINILQLRVEKCKAKLAAITEENSDAELERNTIKEEIAEMEALIPEMTNKLEECNEQGQQAINAIKEAKECFISSVENGTLNGASADGGEVKDITSLVKSKRKISEIDETSNIKKTRLSNSDLASEEANNKIEVDQVAEKQADAEEKPADEKPAAAEAPIENGTTEIAHKTETTSESEKINVDEAQESKPVESSNPVEPISTA